MCTPVVAACDCSEALLASSVPLQQEDVIRDYHTTKSRSYSVGHQEAMEKTYDLQLDDFAVKFHGPNFLRQTRRDQQEDVKTTCCGSSKEGRGSHEIDADGGNVAFGVCIILRHETCFKQDGPVKSEEKTKIWVGAPTANRSSKQDLPTPESPMSKSCHQHEYPVRKCAEKTWRKHTEKSKEGFLLTLKR